MSPEQANRLVDGVGRRLRLIGWTAGITGAVFVFNTIGFLIPIFYDPDERVALARENLPIVAAIVILGGVVIDRWARKYQSEAFDWIRKGREPTVREHRMTLRVASRATLIDAISWLAGGLIVSAFNVHHSLGFAAVVAAAIWAGGETTCALVYLLYERALRPITAFALAVREPGRSVAPGIRSRLMFAWSLGTGVPILGVLVVAIVGATKDGVETGYVAAACIFLSAVALIAGLLATLISARAIADPVSSVGDALDRVADGNFDTAVKIDDSSEIGQLQAGFNRMAEGLREREQIRDLFGRQVGTEVARAALQSGTKLGGEERDIGALFIDIEGSTSMALAMPASEVVRLLNRFFRIVIEEVEKQRGLVNKFEGDAALCVFGAPVESPDPAGEALRAARALCRRLESEAAEIGFGIGVSAGRAVAGNVGSEQRFEYTVIGDPVNEAARLSELAKARGERVIASAAALESSAGSEAESWELGERTVLRGRIDSTGLASPR
jgi:adenylate cyclase